jgi:hypothetical protein
MRRALPAIVLVLACAAPAAAQQRVERFPAPEPEREGRELVVERQSYWLEGAAIGAGAGLGAGLMFIEPGGMCTLSVPGGSCDDDPTPKMLGSAGLMILGGFLGGMIGATIPRE